MKQGLNNVHIVGSGVSCGCNQTWGNWCDLLESRRDEQNQLVTTTLFTSLIKQKSTYLTNLSLIRQKKQSSNTVPVLSSWFSNRTEQLIMQKWLLSWRTGFHNCTAHAGMRFTGFQWQKDVIKTNIFECDMQHCHTTILFTSPIKQKSRFNLKFDKNRTYSTRIVILEENLWWFACISPCWCGLSCMRVTVIASFINAWRFAFTLASVILDILSEWFCDWAARNCLVSVWCRMK